LRRHFNVLRLLVEVGWRSGVASRLCSTASTRRPCELSGALLRGVFRLRRTKRWCSVQFRRSVEYRCPALTKVNSVWRNLRLLIALYSPSALLTNRTAHVPSRERRPIDAVRSRAVHSLRSGLWTKYCEIRACFAYFGVRGSDTSLQLRLAGGASRIRTFITLSNSLNPDVSATCSQQRS